MSDFKGFAGLHITDATEEFEFYGKLETGRFSDSIANTAGETLKRRGLKGTALKNSRLHGVRMLYKQPGTRIEDCLQVR
jgi:hypothetical protein